MAKLGKWGEINVEANVEIERQRKEKQITSCEIKLDGNCWGSRENHPHHRHKRAWYKAVPWLLSNFLHWIMACPYCHDKLEMNRPLTVYYFKKLRPKTLSMLNVETEFKKDMPIKTKLPKAMAQKSKKADWMRPHKCVHCHMTLSGAFCNKCNNLSV